MIAAQRHQLNTLQACRTGRTEYIPDVFYYKTVKTHSTVHDTI